MKKGIQPETYLRIERIEGRTISEALATMYVNGSISKKSICDKWGINTRTLIRIFNELGIKTKTASESVRLQWVEAEDRRKKQGSIFSKYRQNNPHPMLGKKRPDTSNRMTINNPMFDKSIRDKANNKTIQTYKDNPKRFGMYHKPPNEIESIVFNLLKSNGLTVTANELINGRFVDIFIPELNMGIECVHTSRFPLSFDRYKQITSNGCHIIYAVNDFIKSSNVTMIYDYICNPDIFSFLPSINSEYTMVFGRRNGIIFDCNVNQLTIKSIRMNGVYIAHVTAPTNNTIINP